MLPFELDEYRARVAAVKRRMDARGIEVLVLSAPENMNYLTGYDGESSYTHQVVVVSLDAEEPVWIGRAMDAACARYSTYLSPDDILGYPEEFAHRRDLHAMTWSAGALRERGWDGRRLGVEMDDVFFTARCLEELRSGLPASTIEDASLLVNWERVVKSPREIQYMREAAKLSGHGMQVLIDTIEPSVRESVVASRTHAALIEGFDGVGGVGPIGFLMQTGERTATPHLNWSDDVFRPGTATNVELGGVRHRYHSSLARTIFLGQPPDALQGLVPVVVDGMEVALDAARAGNTCESVEAAWRAVLTKAGYEKESRIGYSLGLGYWPGGWVERTASLARGDTTVLQPNMTFHLLLAIWMEDWGFWVSETIRIAEQGPPEQLANFPKQLFVKA